MKKKSYEDDDGRTVADMSELERMPLFLPRFPKRKKGDSGDLEPKMSRSERRATVLAALGAALAIAAVFAAAAAGIIALLILLWT